MYKSNPVYCIAMLADSIVVLLLNLLRRLVGVDTTAGDILLAVWIVAVGVWIPLMLLTVREIIRMNRSIKAIEKETEKLIQETLDILDQIEKDLDDDYYDLTRNKYK